MPKRVMSPTARPAAGRSARGGTGDAGPSDTARGTTPAGGVIAPLTSALPPLAGDASVPATAPAPGGSPGAGPNAAVDMPTQVAPAAQASPRHDEVVATHADGHGEDLVVATQPGVMDDDDWAEVGAPDHQPPVAPDAGGARAGRARPALRRPRTWVVAAVAAVVIALVAWGGVVLAGDNGVDSARSAVLAVATHDITVLSTYDYRHLAHDNALARQIMTPAEWKAYAKPANSVRTTIVKDKAVATAKVQAVGIVRATADRVVVLAAVQQTINDNLLSGPATLPRSYEFTFVPVGGHWRVDYVEQL